MAGVRDGVSGGPRLLVTGGCGFVGRALVRRALAERGARVLNLDLMTYAARREPAADCRLVEGDIADGVLVSRLIDEFRPTAIVNLAAESHVDRSIVGPDPFVHTNIVGVHVLLKSALDHFRRLDAEGQRRFRFVQVSTDEVYGSIDPPGRFTEDSPYRPNSPYAASKAAGDCLVRAYHQTYGLPTVTTHGSNNYGVGQHPEKLIPKMICQALAGGPLPIYGDGRQVRDWLHVDDHCEAIWQALEQGGPGEHYNIGAGCELTNLEVVDEVCDAVDRLRPRSAGASTRQQIAFVADRPGHDRRYAVDSSKASTQLGWRPRRTFAEGLKEIVLAEIAQPSAQ
ncbi:dTDP-glucose 4,6-dehydratase [Pirellulimonas nuda]|uniref:dTDP-glucose 4,6-dehydratase n=1 Tax=Pirellulimonas nuda TaxID=2528009 RepID=A0A518DGB1_9BACT|nr:dTDP-glucose 4,6-dehydratase [Pirellulimonas nuda]QDU90515.1 dTDP-glucose 4,6-dehydratase [Pirellulimonas nuda]